MKKEILAVEELIVEFKKKAAVKGVPGVLLQETLGVKSINGLKHLAKLYSIKGYTKLDKQGLIKAVGKMLLDAERMKEVIYLLDATEWRLFKCAAETNCFQSEEYRFCDCDFLQSMGFVQSYYYDNGFCYVMPREIREIYAGLKKEGIGSQKERSDLLDTYAKAAVGLYGVISQDDFVAIFNSQNQVPTDTDEVFFYLIRQITAEKSNYCFMMSTLSMIYLRKMILKMWRFCSARLAASLDIFQINMSF